MQKKCDNYSVVKKGNTWRTERAMNIGNKGNRMKWKNKQHSTNIVNQRYEFNLNSRTIYTLRLEWNSGDYSSTSRTKNNNLQMNTRTKINRKTIYKNTMNKSLFTIHNTEVKTEKFHRNLSTRAYKNNKYMLIIPSN